MTVESQWVAKAPAWPQTSGEHNDPTGVVEPDFVAVKVTFAGSVADERIEMAREFLLAETAKDPRLGGRVGSGRMRDDPLPEIELVDSPDFGEDAKQIDLTFTIAEPIAPA